MTRASLPASRLLYQLCRRKCWQPECCTAPVVYVSGPRHAQTGSQQISRLTVCSHLYLPHLPPLLIVTCRQQTSLPVTVEHTWSSSLTRTRHLLTAPATHAHVRLPSSPLPHLLVSSRTASLLVQALQTLMAGRQACQPAVACTVLEILQAYLT